MSARGIRRRSRPRIAGVAFIFVTLLLLLGALNSRNNLLYWSFGAAVGALLVSGFVSGLGMSGVRVTALPIPPGEVGRTLRLRYAVSNTNRVMPAFALTIEELPVPEDPAPDVHSWTTTIKPPLAFIEHLPAGAREVIELSITPEARGLVRFDGVVVWSSFPFGLFRKVIEIAARREAIVRPARIAPPRGVLAAATSAHAVTATRARRIGQHGEFHALRPYQPGDSQRAIAWRASARSGDLLVRQSAQASPRRLWIVLAPIEDEDPAERAVSLAAGLADAAHRLGFRVGLSTPDQRVHAAPGRAGLARVLDALAVTDPVRARAHHTPLRTSPTDEVVLVHAGTGRLSAGWHSLDATATAEPGTTP